MSPRITLSSLALLACGGTIVLAAAPGSIESSPVQQRPITPPMADPLQDTRPPPAGNILPSGAKAQNPAGQDREPRGNPLWGIPLRSLSNTRERPIFLPSRRPPAPAVAGPPVEAPAPPLVQAEPDRPRLTLVGAVIGETEGIAVFLDEATNDVVRLRTGESHSGWILRSVKGREATLEKDRETVVLALPVPGDAPRRSKEQEL
jgi:general secretion pathway protein N